MKISNLAVNRAYPIALGDVLRKVHIKTGLWFSHNSGIGILHYAKAF